MAFGKIEVTTWVVEEKIFPLPFGKGIEYDSSGFFFFHSYFLKNRPDYNMISGQENLKELLLRHPQVWEVLFKYGVDQQALEQLEIHNLTELALHYKISLRKILLEVAEKTGEELLEPKIKENAADYITKKNELRIGKPDCIKNVIVFHSGKGGVGKTTMAVNMAFELKNLGFQVGLLDADIDCPNVLKLLKLEGKLVSNEKKMMVPVEYFGVKIVSMGFVLSQEDQVLFWRGPIISRALEQFVHDTDWGALDFLIVDLPPGTGDAPITMLNILKESKMILVTTPQELALLDTKKAARMAEKMDIKILGLIENMCGDVFGKNGGRNLAQELGISFLGQVDLNKKYTQLNNRLIDVVNDENLHVIAKKIADSIQ